MKKVGGHLIADGNAINIDIGFVPDKFTAWEGMEETSPSKHIWFKEQANTANANGQYGLLLTGSTGVITKHAAATNGFAEYNTVTLKALLPAPNGNGEVSATIAAAFVAGTAQPTARTTAVVGTTLRPSTANGFLYECTTSAGVYGTEPTTWGTVVGGTTSDGTNTWTCRTENLKNVGVKGITIGATASTDTDEWTWEAELYDSVAAEKDSATYDPVGKYPNN